MILIGGIMIALSGDNPFQAYGAILKGALGDWYAVAATVSKAMPIIGAGICAALAFKAGLLNIGGEGQMIVGGLAALGLALEFPDADPTIMIPGALLASFVAGAIWGGIAGVLKAYFNVNEILSTIMLNQIANFWMIYLVSNVFVDPEKKQLGAPIPETRFGVFRM